MSFLSVLSHRVATPRVLIPTIIAGGAIGLAYSVLGTGSIKNETGRTFKGNDEWIDLKLAKVVDVTHNTKHFYFDLPDKNDISGLVIASCLLSKFVTPKGNNVVRPYTPVSDVDQKGVIEFVIKRYEDGKMTNHIFDLKVNDTLSFKGPIVKWKWEANQYKKIALIGGGSGITPLYQLIHEITKNPEDKTQVDLYYGNISENDILLRKELDEVAAKHPDQLKLYYFVDKASPGWRGHTGFIDKEFLKEHLPGPSQDSKIFVCGPPPLYKAISGTKNSPTDQGEVTGILADLGYTKDQVYKF